MSNMSLEEESARKLLAVRVWSEGWMDKLLLSPRTAALTHHHINQHFLCSCLKAGALNQKIQILKQNTPETNLQQEFGWEWGAQIFTGEGEPAHDTFGSSALPCQPCLIPALAPHIPSEAELALCVCHGLGGDAESTAPRPWAAILAADIYKELNITVSTFQMRKLWPLKQKWPKPIKNSNLFLVFRHRKHHFYCFALVPVSTTALHLRK